MAFEANAVLAAVMTVNLLHALTDHGDRARCNRVVTPATSARNCAKVRVVATRRLIAVWMIATIVLAASGGFVAYRLVHPESSSASVLHGQIVWPSHKRPAPDFALHDQGGHRIALSSLRGRVVVLAFLDSRCTRLCPLEGHELAVVQRNLPADAQPSSSS